MNYKICTKCGEELPATTEYFAKSSKVKSGLRGDCKRCQSIYRKINYDEKREEIRKKQNIYLKRYNIENSEKISEYKKEYYRENKEIILEKQKDLGKIYRRNNIEKRRLYAREYKKQNRELFNNYKQLRRAKKRKLPSTLTLKQWEQIKKDFNNRCCYCGEKAPLEQEHFIPLSKDGEYTISNIIPSCKSCNSSKQDRDFIDWYPNQIFYNKSRERFILSYLNYTSKNMQQLSIL